MKRKNIKSVIIAMVCVIVIGSSISIGSPIPVTSYKKQSNGILFNMKPGKMKVQVRTDKIIHVCYTPTSNFPTKTSLMVNRTSWPSVDWKMKETKNNVTLVTNKVQAKIALKTGAITFYDSTGKILLQEEPNGGKKLIPDTVAGETVYNAKQTFLSPPDENYYGLGQHQDGNMNYRGTSVKLKQQNPIAVVPFLVTNKEYTILWNNSSKSEFDAASGRKIIPQSQLYQSNGSSGGLTGRYYDNKDLTNLKLTRVDKKINFNWKGDSPDTSIKPETFSIKWDGKIKTLGEGYYTFYTECNDGVRLWVNGELVINNWTNYFAPVKRTDKGKIWLDGNKKYNIKMEYYDKSWEAVARLGWIPPASSSPDVVTWRSEVANAIDYYFIYGPSIDEEIRGYRYITGKAPLMGKWALGFWQCKNRYKSQSELLEIAKEYRNKNIPIDNIVQDWQYWGESWNSMKFDKRRYPSPGKMADSLHDMNFHLMISIWPNFGKGSEVYKEMKNNEYFISGTSWYDPLNAKARNCYWRNINDTFFSIGVDAWWLDATEPNEDADSWHNRTTALGKGARYLNTYSLMNAKGLYKGQRNVTSKKRVFILTRSAFAGQQRYSAATWSGDIGANFSILKRQIPAGLNFCLSGIPYWTTDIGGYGGGDPKNPAYREVFVRWFQYGTFCPIFRVHGWRSTNELWSYGNKAQKILTEYDNLRYRLMPYIYSLAWKVTNEGYNMMRALVMDFVNDRNVANISDQFMFGPAILVNPVTEAGATSRYVYLPGGTLWYDFWNGDNLYGGQTISASAPLKKIPLYIKAGSIIPMGPFLQYASEKPSNPIELRVYRGADGEFTLYEDDGTTYNYEEGEYVTIPITWDEDTQTLTIGERQGSFPGMLSSRTFNIIWVSSEHGIGVDRTQKPDKSVTYNGNAITVSPTTKQEK